MQQQRLTVLDPAAFEKMYLAVRKKEKRIYTDAQVALLPLIHSTHPHFKEWQIRMRSAKRLVNYLRQKKKALSVLEIGCGNGWLAAKIATIPTATIIGADVNNEELEQAKRVFAKKQNLQFENGSLEDILLSGKKFDIVVFAASLQYFSSFHKALSAAENLLNENGEIHILDTHFYTIAAMPDAKQRTEKHFASLGYSRMAGYYFHHLWEDVKKYYYQLLFDPASLKNKITGNKDPFPWIVIRK